MPNDATESVAEHSSMLQPSINWHAPVIQPLCSAALVPNGEHSIASHIQSCISTIQFFNPSNHFSFHFGPFRIVNTLHLSFIFSTHSTLISIIQLVNHFTFQSFHFQPLNVSAILLFYHPHFQPFHLSTIQLFNNSTFQQFPFIFPVYSRAFIIPLHSMYLNYGQFLLSLFKYYSVTAIRPPRAINYISLSVL